MFGFSVSEQAQKLYEEGVHLHIVSLERARIIPSEKMPDYIWTDAYMQGFFVTLVMQLRSFQTTSQPGAQFSPKDLQVITEVFHSYLCPNYADEVLKSAQRHKMGDTPQGWDVDDYILATNHAVNVVALAYGILGEQYKKEIEILEARTLALKLMGSTEDAALSPCLFQIYMENRINFLKK